VAAVAIVAVIASVHGRQSRGDDGYRAVRAHAVCFGTVAPN
jgi:hypothetical protein